MNTTQLGLACWGLRELPLEAQLALARRVGARGMEFSIANAPKDFSLAMDAADIARVRRAYDQAELPLNFVVTGNDFTQADPAAVQADLDKVERVIALCGALGAQYLRIFAGFSPADDVVGERFTRMAAALTRAASAAERRHVTLAVELHGGVEPCGMGTRYIHSVTTRLDRIEEILAAVPASVMLLMDPANLWAVGVTEPQRYYRALRDRVAYFHIKDFVTLPDGSLRPAACGRSALDWAALVNEASDFDGALMAEYENPEDVEQGMRDCLNYMKMLLRA